MMRAAYVCADPGVPVFGRKGASIHVQEVVRTLNRRGIVVTLIAPSLGGERPAGLEAVKVRRLPDLPPGDAGARERGLLAANHDLHVALAEEGPFDLIYERHSLWSFAAMEYARDVAAPGVLEVNAPLIEEQAKHRSLIDRAAAERAAGRAFGAATAIVAVSNEVAKSLERQCMVARCRVTVIPNGVNPQRFHVGVMPALPAAPGSFTVGFLGTLKPWHGLPVLADAVTALHRSAPKVRLLIVGDGPERASLETDLAARGLRDAARFTGSVAPEEVPGLLASMDVGVAPYREGDFYFSPLKVYEYMAAGLPVVASGIGQLSTLIRDGSTGILCPPGDVRALAAALDRLRTDPALRRRLGAAAREYVVRHHTWDAVVGRMLQLAGLGASQGLGAMVGG